MSTKRFLAVDLLCVICHDIFEDPVILTCSHSFCRACVEQFWQSRIPPQCPVCSRRCSKPCYPRNLALRNVCETFRQDSSSPRASARQRVGRLSSFHYAVGAVSDLAAALLSFGVFRRVLRLVLFLLILFGPTLSKRVSRYSVFANKDNYLYRIFLSSVWGWTCILTGSYIFLLSFSLRRSLLLYLRHLFRLAAASAVWLGLRWLLTSLEDASGSCFEPLSTTLKACMKAASLKQDSRLLLRDGESKTTCLRAGFEWRGFEVSQEALLLCLCCLLLMEEMAVFRQCVPAPRTAFRLVFLLCVSLLGLWFFLLFCQLAYFPQFPSQLIGGAAGFLVWKVLYQGWFMKETSWYCPCAPGSGLNM